MRAGDCGADPDDDLIFGAAAAELDLHAPLARTTPRWTAALAPAGDGDDDLVYGAAAWELQLVPTPER